MHKTVPTSGARPDIFLLASGWALFIFSLFPYFYIIPIPTDTQPYAVLFAAFIFAIGNRVALPLSIWILFIPLVAAVVIFIATSGTFNGLRSLIGYTSIFFISASVLILASKNIRLSDVFLDVSVGIWFIVGAVQTFIAPGFLTAILARSQTTDIRGVTALAVEPSSYATMMIFIIAIYFIRRREKSWPVLFCMIQIIAFSQSALGILFALLILSLYTLLRFSAPVAIIGLTAIALISSVLFINAETILAGTRFGALLNVLYTHPQTLFTLDESVAARVSNLFYSIKGAFDDWLTPHGFDAWASFADHQEQIYRDIFVKRGISGDRIMSGYGAALFELGLIGFIIPTVITVGVLQKVGIRHFGRAAALLILIHALLLTPVPLALPMVGILIGELFIKADPDTRARLQRRAILPLPMSSLTRY